jgi:hypothetical protein
MAFPRNHIYELDKEFFECFFIITITYVIIIFIYLLFIFINLFIITKCDSNNKIIRKVPLRLTEPQNIVVIDATGCNSQE